jgi:hypothetical protein
MLSVIGEIDIRVVSDFLMKALVLLESRFKKAYSFIYDEELPAERQVCDMVFACQVLHGCIIQLLHLPLVEDLRQHDVIF